MRISILLMILAATIETSAQLPLKLGGPTFAADPELLQPHDRRIEGGSGMPRI